MRFAAFADLHVADYSTGVTALDCAAVERAFTDFCLDRQIPFCIFCGDRYLAHEPQDYVRVISDQEQKYRNDKGIVTFSLVGNHDLYAKAPVSGHSNRHLQTVWGEFLPNIVVMDEVRTYRHAGAPGVAVHALPACFDWTDKLLESFDFVPGEFNLLAFHDLLKGSVIDHSTSYKAPKGQRIDLIDDARFDLVLGGDVHIPQKLDFQHTRGGYVGAAIQQSRRDRGNSRGWLWVHQEPGAEKLTMESIEGPSPRFLDAAFDLDAVELPSLQELMAAVGNTYDDDIAGNILDIILTGSRERLEAVPEGWHRALQAATGARRINAPMKRVKNSVQPVRRSASGGQKTPIEDLQVFLESGRAALDGNDPARLLEKAAKILKVA